MPSTNSTLSRKLPGDYSQPASIRVFAPSFPANSGRQRRRDDRPQQIERDGQAGVSDRRMRPQFHQADRRRRPAAKARTNAPRPADHRRGDKQDTRRRRKGGSGMAVKGTSGSEQCTVTWGMPEPVRSQVAGGIQYRAASRGGLRSQQASEAVATITAYSSQARRDGPGRRLLRARGAAARRHARVLYRSSVMRGTRAAYRHRTHRFMNRTPRGRPARRLDR